VQNWGEHTRKARYPALHEMKVELLQTWTILKVWEATTYVLGLMMNFWIAFWFYLDSASKM